MVITEEQIAEAKAKSKEVYLLEANGEQVLVRPATRAEWKKHLAALASDESRPVAFESLLIDCAVVPDRNELGAMLERQPGIAMTFARRIQKVSGLTSEVTEKKL